MRCTRHRASAALLRGLCVLLLGLVGPTWATGISQAREVAPPPGDRGDLLYEVPIAPLATSQPTETPKARSTVPAVQAAASSPITPRQAARVTVPGQEPKQSVSRSADKPVPSAAGSARRPVSAAVAASSHTQRGERAAEKDASRSDVPQARAMAQRARGTDVPRETPPRQRQHAQEKPIVAEPMKPSQRSRPAGKVLAKSDRGAKSVAPMVRPRMSSAKLGARIADKRASQKTLSAKSASASKRAVPSTRASVSANRKIAGKTKAQTTRTALRESKTPVRSHGATQATRQVKSPSGKQARPVTQRKAPGRATRPTSTAQPKKIAPQKSSRPPSR